MEVITPITIGTAQLHSSNVAETDYAAWSGTVAYVTGDRRIDTTTHEVFEAVKQTAIAVVTLTLANPGVVAWQANGLAADTPLAFSSTGALPTGLTAGTTYYVKTAGTDSFTVSATVGGAAIQFSGSQSGVHTATAQANFNRDPTDLTNRAGVTPWWRKVSATNRYKMFDGSSSSQTENAEEIVVELDAGRVRALFLGGLDAATYRVDVIKDPTIVTNGDFAVNVSGWTASAASLTHSAGTMLVAADISGANGIAYQALTTVVGKRYRVTGTIDGVANTNNVGIGNGPGSVGLYELGWDAADRDFETKFVATATTTYVSLYVAPTTGQAKFDDIVCRPIEYDTGETSLVAPSSGTLTGYLYDPIVRKTDLVLTDLPRYASARIRVTIKQPGGTAKCGSCVVGLTRDIGEMQWAPEIRILDYSRKETNEFGDTVLVKRKNAKMISCELFIDNADVDEIRRLLSTYTAIALVWIGSEEYSSTIIYGFFRDLRIVLTSPAGSNVSLDLEELA